MNERKVANGLGWFSIGLGVTEVVADQALGRALGMEERSWVLRLFGLREIAAGVGIFASENPGPWLWARVAGDVLDMATLAPGLSEDNPRREKVAAAIGSILGITALDYWCARRFGSGRPHGSLSVHRRYVAEGSSRRLPSGEFPASRS